MPLPLDRRALGAFAALSVLALLAPAYFLWGGGLRYPSNNRYDSVFRGIALVSADPAATLAQLDVDPEARRLVGTSYFDAGLSQADLARADHVSLFRVAGLYLQHPATIVEAGRRVGAVLAKPYSVSLGQYTESESRGKKRYFRPLMFHFSRVRPFVLGRPWAVWTWAALSSSWAASSLVRRRRDLFATATVFLVILFASQVVIVVIGEGFFALARHLLAARFALDGAVVLSLLGVVREVFPGWSRRSARRVKRWNAGSEGRARAIYRHLFIASRSGDAPS